MSFGNPFILGSKVKVTSHKNSVGVDHCPFVSAGFFLLSNLISTVALICNIHDEFGHSV